MESLEKKREIKECKRKYEKKKGDGGTGVENRRSCSKEEEKMRGRKGKGVEV